MIDYGCALIIVWINFWSRFLPKKSSFSSASSISFNKSTCTNFFCIIRTHGFVALRVFRDCVRSTKLQSERKVCFDLHGILVSFCGERIVNRLHGLFVRVVKVASKNMAIFKRFHRFEALRFSAIKLF